MIATHRVTHRVAAAFAFVAAFPLAACAKDTAEPEPAVQASAPPSATPRNAFTRGPRRNSVIPGIRQVGATGANPAESAAAPVASAPADSAPAASAPPPPFDVPPAVAFIDVVAAKPSPVMLRGCDEVAVAVVSGKVTALGESLAAGDILLARGAGSFDMKGVAGTVVGRVTPRACTPSAAIDKKVVRGAATKPLVFSQGAMRAYLDVDEATSPDLYVGRLEGTAPMAEHAHPGVYEMICAVQADGVLTIDGRPQIVAPKTCAVIPPGAKHAWRPNGGAKLVAVQMYAPPGPEQRFKKLAADEGAGADGG